MRSLQYAQNDNLESTPRQEGRGLEQDDETALQAEESASEPKGEIECMVCGECHI
jgi:hypothetical protein